MKNLTQGLLLTVLFLGVVSLFGKLFVIDPIELETRGYQENARRLQNEDQLLQNQLAALKKNISPTTIEAGTRLLKAGDEQTLIKNIFSFAATSSVIISSFRLEKSFRLKPPSADDAPAKQGKAELPQFDQNGNPIGVASDNEPQEEQDVEILPLQMELKGTFRGWGTFLSALHRNLPLFGIRQMNITWEKSGVGKGMLELVFPCGKYVSPPAPSEGDSKGQTPDSSTAGGKDGNR